MHTTRPFEAPPVLISDPDMRREAAEDDEIDKTDPGTTPTAPVEESVAGEEDPGAALDTTP